ncbi:Hypp9289 [Branchiostoma lanceolatum]|uniref:Hypp9289 protein n=1 Tax=Branchiostoma lanceolatum TaxID=7740 RepID=A0A8K0ELA3_BRALA|nr:Hypp9289 [Branchiostoma lanceolatum]
MKSLVVFVASVLAVAFAQTAANPPNFAVKEENGKCVWSFALDKPTGGCPKTEKPGQVVKDLAADIAGQKARQAKMETQLPLDKASIQSRITMTEVERLKLDGQVAVIDRQLTALEDENKKLGQRLNGIPNDPKNIGIKKAIANYQAMVLKLAQLTEALLKKP